MTDRSFTSEDFVFELPEELIAAYPAERRGDSRLLVLPIDPEKPLRHRMFSDLPDYLREGDLLVLNNTRVIPARLFGRRSTGGRVELLLLHEEESGPGFVTWRVLARPARKLKPGDQIDVAEGAIPAKIVEIHDAGERSVWFETGGEPFPALLERHGQMPLPPYILRRRAEEGDLPERHHETDRERYQTVFAERQGSVAAPTAGLHFTPEMFSELQAKGVEIRYVTLHVGAGTFTTMEPGQPVTQHKMHFEEYEISPETAEAVNEARRGGRRIVAVGTTTVRTLESAWNAQAGGVAPGTRKTDLMISPGYRLRVIDGLLTNFHLPRSTLLLLVSAIAGRERILEAYAEAVRENYRFFSYGDAMLLI